MRTFCVLVLVAASLFGFMRSVQLRCIGRKKLGMRLLKTSLKKMTLVNWFDLNVHAKNVIDEFPECMVLPGTPVTKVVKPDDFY